MKKGQISIEYLVIIGFIFVVLVVLVNYSYEEATKNINTVQAEDAILSLVRSADQVHTLGAGSQDLVWITLPGGVENFNYIGRTLTLSFEIKGRATEISYRTLSNITGTLPNTRGTYRMLVQSYDNSTVNFEIK